MRDDALQLLLRQQLEQACVEHDEGLLARDGKGVRVGEGVLHRATAGQAVVTQPLLNVCSTLTLMLRLFAWHEPGALQHGQQSA